MSAAEEKTAAEAPREDAAVAQAPKESRFASFFTFFHLLFYANPTWVDHVLLLVGTIAACAAGTPFPLMGILFGQLVDNLNSASCAAPDAFIDRSAIQASINSTVLKLTYIAIASFLLIYIYVVCWNLFSRRLEARLRDRYFQSLLRQDATFYDKRSAGELSTRMNDDIQAIQSGTSEKVGICLACTGFFLTGYIVAFIKNWKLAAMLLSLIPAFMAMAFTGSRYTARFATAKAGAVASASAIAQETLSHIAVVQAFGAGPRLEKKYASMSMVAQKEGIKKAVTTAIQAGALYFIAYSANALSFWQGSQQIADSLEGDNGGVTIGQIYTVIFLLIDSCVVLGYVAPLLPIISTGVASFRKLRADIDSVSDIDSSSDAGQRLPTTIGGGLEFRNISFAYPSRIDRPVLTDVSFDCPPGKYTALVGFSGSGKSTIAGLATRLYDPSHGSVSIDGYNIKDVNVKNLRSYMSLVQQEPSLLDRSVMENIALGILNSPWEHHAKFRALILSSALEDIASKVREGADLDSTAAAHSADAVELVSLIRHAASLADAASFIERLESGYATSVGISGKLVSGGQRQRIALARALVRDPKILILDEATASLDSASEKRIQRAVESIAANRTVIAIAHRLSTIKNADNIIAMSAGKILEQGTHAELMALDGNYASMVRLQNIEAEKSDDTFSTTSTTKGDADAPITEKQSISDEKLAVPTVIEKTEATTEEDQPAEESADTALDAQKKATTVLSNILGLVRPQLMYLVAAIIAGIIVGATFSGAGLIFGHTVGRINPCHPVNEIRWAGRFFGGMYFMLAVVELFANSASWSGFGYVAEKLLYKMRVLSFRSLYVQSLDWHQAKGRSPASLMSVVTSDAAAVGGFSGSIVGTIFSIAVNFIVAIIVSHVFAWKIAIVCLVVVPILLGAGIMQVRSLSQFERKHASAYADAVGITVEAVNSFKTVSSLSIEDEVLETYRRALAAPQNEIALFSVYTNFWLALANSVGNLIYAFAYWWGSNRITQGEYDQTQFYVVLISMLVSANLWGNMFSLAPEVSRARAAASRILSLMDLNPDKIINENSGDDVEATATSLAKAGTSPRGSTITFRDVSFAYPARPQLNILNNMSFTIPAGQFVGLVGPSGAGKSTIMSLVQRMYRPTGGAVEIDGVNICAREGTDFRDDIAVVPQDCALFDGTIRFNVSLGARPGQVASDEDIEAACRLANIHDTIVSLPNGYDTECGPNGSRLSGGQRQRLAIARALVRQPRLLLLDESTSALDAESERALQEGLERASRGITVIAITHRLHTVRKADVIFVVEGGQVVDKGKHEELVERSESYRVNALQQMLD